MSKYGCGKEIVVYIPTKYSYKEHKTVCGSTSYTGGVNQCDDCANKTDYIPEPYEDEGDMEYDHRINGLDDDQ